MKKLIGALIVGLLALALPTLAAAQTVTHTGPTVHEVVLDWTNPTAGTFTYDCVYRSAANGAAGAYVTPPIYCSTAPITTYTDTAVVSGDTYHYAVTAYNTPTSQESQYSNDVGAQIPTSPAAPSGLSTGTVAELRAPQSQERQEYDVLALVFADNADGLQLKAVVR